MDQLLCPKCHNIMSRYERNRVVVDQCTECGGLFLDRGELDHLIRAEAIYYGAVPAVAAGTRESHRAYDPERGSDDREHRKRKRRSFFEDLLDLG